MTTAGAQPRRRMGMGTRILLGFIGVVVCAFVGVIGIGLFGQVTGEEFSPSTFQTRSYVYYQIPGLGVQVTPVVRTVGNYAIATELQTLKLLPKPTAEDEWDQIVVQTAGGLTQGDAFLLCGYFELSGDGQLSKWVNWSQTQPKLAKVFWPYIVQIAEQKEYVLAPEMFAVADEFTPRDDSEPRFEEFEQALDNVLIRRLADWGKAKQELQEHQAAAKYYSRVLELEPEHTAALGGRAQCYVLLGENDKARKDREELKRLTGSSTSN